jgi:hypothetical protein
MEALGDSQYDLSAGIRREIFGRAERAGPNDPFPV